MEQAPQAADSQETSHGKTVSRNVSQLVLLVVGLIVMACGLSIFGLVLIEGVPRFAHMFQAMEIVPTQGNWLLSLGVPTLRAIFIGILIVQVFILAIPWRGKRFGTIAMYMATGDLLLACILIVYLYGFVGRIMSYIGQI